MSFPVVAGRPGRSQSRWTLLGQPSRHGSHPTTRRLGEPCSKGGTPPGRYNTKLKPERGYIYPRGSSSDLSPHQMYPTPPPGMASFDIAPGTSTGFLEGPHLRAERGGRAAGRLSPQQNYRQSPKLLLGKEYVVPPGAPNQSASDHAQPRMTRRRGS